MTERGKLLGEIEAFLRDYAMAPTTFGRKAINDTALVSRLRNGRNVTLGTVDRIHVFMAKHRRENKPARPTSGAGRARRAA